MPFLTFQRAARPARAALARLDPPRRARRRARQPAGGARSALRHEQARARTATPAPTTRWLTPWPGTARRGGPAARSGWTRAVGRASSRSARRRARCSCRAANRTPSRPGTGAGTPRRCAPALRARRGRDQALLRSSAWSTRCLDCARQLFGSSFCCAPNCAPYHPDVKVYEVRGGAMARACRRIPCTTTSARASKRSGAWMSNYRQQSRNVAGGGAISPIVVNNNNFAKGSRGADAAELRRRAHAVPRVRPRPARAAVERHLRAACRHQRAARFRRAALAAVRALAHRARGAEEARTPRSDRRADSRCRWCAAARRAQVQPGLRDGALHRPALVDMAVHSMESAEGPTSSPPSAPCSSASGCRPAGMNHRLPHFQHLFRVPATPPATTSTCGRGARCRRLSTPSPRPAIRSTRRWRSACSSSSTGRRFAEPRSA